MLAGMSASEKNALHLTTATDYYYLTQVGVRAEFTVLGTVTGNNVIAWLVIVVQVSMLAFEQL